MSSLGGYSLPCDGYVPTPPLDLPTPTGLSTHTHTHKGPGTRDTPQKGRGTRDIPPPVNRHTPVKTLLSRNFVCGR